MLATRTLAGLLLAGLCTGPLQAQETRPEAQAERDVQALIQELGHDSYKVRLKAEKELRALGEKALPALREAAENAGDPEVQWRARRLLRQIESGDEGGLRRRPQGEDRAPPPRTFPRTPFTFPDLDRTFERLFEDLERDFGIDIPRRRFFHDDFFRDLEQQMQDMRQRLQQGLPGGTAEGRSMSMQVGPDGVRVEIKTKGEDGKEETKVYEAPDLESFRQKYPGVLEGQGLGGFELRLGDPDDFGRPPAWPRWNPRPPRALQPPKALQPPPAWPAPGVTQAPPPEGKRLGVLVREEIDPAVRDFLGLEPGLGLQVEEVQEGTLAEDLGLRPGDIVLKIGETGIRGVGDVQEALGRIEAGETVRVEINRRGQSLVLEAEKKAAKEERKGKLEKR